MHDHEIGFGKPPLRTRFKRGSSGNPKGRPRGSKNYDSILRKLLTEKLPGPGKKGGKITRLEMMVRDLVDDAVEGKASAVMKAMVLMEKYDTAPEPQAPDRGPHLDFVAMAARFGAKKDSAPAPESETSWAEILESKLPEITAFVQRTVPITGNRDSGED